MICYQIYCTLKEPIMMPSRDNTEEIRYFDNSVSNAMNEFNKKTYGKSCIFISAVNKCKLELTAVIKNKINIREYCDEFMSCVDFEYTDISIEEITIGQVTKNEPQFRFRFEFDTDYLDGFCLSEFSSRGGFLNLYEKIAEPITKDEAVDFCKTNLFKDSMYPEIKRIFSASSQNSQNVQGIPVHYFIQSDNREKALEILVSSLFSVGRVKSGRYSFLNIDEKFVYNSRTLVAFFECSKDTTVIINADKMGNDDNDTCGAGKGIPDLLYKFIDKYKNYIQFVFTFTNKESSVMRTVEDILSELTFVTLSDDFVFNERAKNYLKMLCQKDNVKWDRKLTSACAKDTAYCSKDLIRMYNLWFSNTLKTKIYPQYSSFRKSAIKTAEENIKGKAYEELTSIIGLAKAKEVINSAITYSKAQKLFSSKGMKKSNTAMHMVFTGNPGTAKTTVARLFAQILKDNGVLSEGKLIECGRSDLVGKYVGWTAVQVKNIFKRAKGSVLFIDEAYSLCDDRAGSYGDEAINTIVQEMENNREDMVVIFAGYPEPMRNFIERNPGLKSRIAFNVSFDNYSTDELWQITEHMAISRGYKLSDDVKATLENIYSQAVKSDDFGNGRFVRNVIEQAQMKQAIRLTEKEYDEVSGDDIATLTADDFVGLTVQTEENVQRAIGFGR